MNFKKLIAAILSAVMICGIIFTSCVSTPEAPEESDDPSEESSSSEQNPGEESSEGESSEEETTVITDVMIGETLEAEYAEDFSVAKVFSNDMVVQRNEHIRVWGFAPESENGKKVSGEFKGMFAEALIENGEWCITFGARLEADTEGAEMKIYTDKKTVSFEGVLVGDVYLVMGQSNAAYTVSNHLAYNDPATQGGSASDINENSIIRLNNLNGSGGGYSKKGTAYVYPDLENVKFWSKTNAQNTLGFSALGYYFARQMVEKNPTIPIGLMEVAVGGAPLISFLPNDIADEFGGDYKDVTTGIYYSSISAEHQGRYLYNCYLAPVSRYAIAGILWYQGESNNALQDAMKFNETFAALMTRLRSTHNVINKNIPVFVTEFPSIYKKPADFTGTWYYMELGLIRSYIGSIPTVLKNSYVAASGDLWADKTFFNNLHPNCKYEQAGRLAALADVIINKNGTLDKATGPIFQSADISEDKKTVILTFSNIGDGLATKDGGSAVMGMVGLLDDSMGHSTVTPVSATITGKDQITVVFEDAVKAVSYNYSSEDHYGETINLCNSTGCPASGFITPYEDRSLEGYKEGSLVNINTKALSLKGKSFDVLSAGGQNLLDVGAVDTQLAAMGNVVDVYQGTADLGVFGWVGFGYETLMFGYSIDGGEIIFDTYPTIPDQPVINAGGKYAVRFNYHINISELSLGKHTVTLAAFVDLKDGIAVRLLTFKINIVEREAAPAGLELPMYSENGYGFINASFDQFNVGSNEMYMLEVDKKIAAAHNTVTVKKGTQIIAFAGWVGFSYEIEKFGYAIDGNSEIMTFDPQSAEQAVISLGGEMAKRYVVIADVSKLDTGMHAFDMLVRIKTGENTTALLKMLTFTLAVED